MKYITIVFLFITTLSFGQTFEMTKPGVRDYQQVVVPYELSGVRGYFVDSVSFDRTLFKLNDYNTLRVTDKLKERELQRMYGLYEKTSNERDAGLAKIDKISRESKEESDKKDLIITSLKSTIIENSEKHLKTVIKVGAFGVGLSVTTWVLGKFGVL